MPASHDGDDDDDDDDLKSEKSKTETGWGHPWMVGLHIREKWPSPSGAALKLGKV